MEDVDNLKNLDQLAKFVFYLPELKDKLNPKMYKKLAIHRSDTDKTYLDTAIRLMLISWERADIKEKEHART